MLRRNEQLVVDRERGDCLRACLTSVLGIPNDLALPGGGDPDWFPRWTKFLAQFGLELHCQSRGFWQTGYWVASVYSKNYEGGSHAIVMLGQEVAWDPTTTENRYEEGTNLLSAYVHIGGTEQRVVTAGYMLSLTDGSRVAALAELQGEAHRRESQESWLRNAHPALPCPACLQSRTLSVLSALLPLSAGGTPGGETTTRLSPAIRAQAGELLRDLHTQTRLVEPRCTCLVRGRSTPEQKGG